MSDGGFNDELLERELFGADSDELDGGMDTNMDVDDILSLNESITGRATSSLTAPNAPAIATTSKPADTPATNGTTGPAKVRAVPKLDIEMDTPPGALTMLEHEPRTRITPKAGFDSCKSYEVLPTASLINSYQIHTLAATGNMRWVFSGGEDGYIKRWDFTATMNGKQMMTLGQRHSHVDSVSKAGVMAGYWEHADTDDVLSPVFSMDVQSEALWLASGMRSGRIALWSVRHDEGRRLTVLDKHKQPVSVLRISPDEHGLVSGAWDRAVLYWDLDSGKLARGFTGHASQISSIEFQPTWTVDKFRALSGTAPDETAEFDFKTPSPVLMTASIDGQCLLWDVRAPKALPHRFDTPQKTPPWASSACWSPDGKRIFVGRRNNTVDEYEFNASSAPVRTLKLPPNSGPVTALAALPNNRNLICGSTDNVRMWDLDETKGVKFQVIPGHHGSTVSCALIDESARFMITACGNRGWDGTSNNVCLCYEIDSAK